MTSHKDSYSQAFRRSLDDPESFWLEAAGAIDWYSAPTRALSQSHSSSGTWFPDASLNTCVNALDRHVHAGFGHRTALIYDLAMVPEKKRYTYGDLLDEVAGCAGVLSARGVRAGDRVIVYMPMIPEAVIAMLACARIGAVHSVVFGGFAAAELAKRVDDAEPVALLTARGGLERSRHIEYMPIVAEA
ncbi:hypothetical protein ASG84_11350 [Rhodococcus sp. Leaf278]|nr:hypothetical protein ASG84_11350 [Rhodococcus sp. Leaf278]